MPYKHNRTQHDALYVFDLYKAQDEELTFYRTSSRCMFHFSNIPAECLQTVLTSNDVVLRERRWAASWTSTTTTPEHTITHTDVGSSCVRGERSKQQFTAHLATAVLQSRRTDELCRCLVRPQTNHEHAEHGAAKLYKSQGDVDELELREIEKFQCPTHDRRTDPQLEKYIEKSTSKCLSSKSTLQIAIQPRRLFGDAELYVGVTSAKPRTQRPVTPPMTISKGPAIIILNDAQCHAISCTNDGKPSIHRNNGSIGQNW